MGRPRGTPGVVVLRGGAVPGMPRAEAGRVEAVWARARAQPFLTRVPEWGRLPLPSATAAPASPERGIRGAAAVAAVPEG